MHVIHVTCIIIHFNNSLHNLKYIMVAKRHDTQNKLVVLREEGYSVTQLPPEGNVVRVLFQKFE